MARVLITGVLGQIGSELAEALLTQAGLEKLVGVDIREQPSTIHYDYVQLELPNKERLLEIIERYQIDTIYHLVSLLSADGEKDPLRTWKINIESLREILEIAREKGLKVFWPSSIAAFGAYAPADQTPQHIVLEPSTMYGVTKVTGELLCNYYWKRYGVDVRSIRYPGLISYKVCPTGGTTDYATEVFYRILQKESFVCPLSENSYLPMMYMDDAIRATLELMNATQETISVRTSYNLSGVSFSPRELFAEIEHQKGTFDYRYEIDPIREQIAASWPNSINDSCAQHDWGWKATYDLQRLVAVMFDKLRAKLNSNILLP